MTKFLIVCLALFLYACDRRVPSKEVKVGMEKCLSHGGLSSIVAEAALHDTFICADGARFVIFENGAVIE